MEQLTCEIAPTGAATVIIEKVVSKKETKICESNTLSLLPLFFFLSFVLFSPTNFKLMHEKEGKKDVYLGGDEQWSI